MITNPEKEFLIKLGKNIRQHRLRQNMTQAKLAELCAFEKASISRIESGKINVTLYTLHCISDRLKVPVSRILSS